MTPEAPEDEEPTPPPRPQDTWVERGRHKVPEGSWRRQLYDTMFLPLPERREFLQGERALRSELTPSTGDTDADAKRAADVLKEAQDIYASAEDRAAGATSRATTLQGAVAVATSLLFAGAALVLDRAKLEGTGWRVLFAVLLLATTLSLVMAGVRALSATSTIHVWHRPTASNIVERTSLSDVEANVRLAAETLVDYSYNTRIANWKVAYLGAAAWWFRTALALFVALAALIGTYAIWGPDTSETTSKTSPSQTSATGPTNTGPANRRATGRIPTPSTTNARPVSPGSTAVPSTTKAPPTNTP